MTTRLQNEPKTSDTAACSEAAAGSIIAFLRELIKEHKLSTTEFITLTLIGMNYSLMPGIVELLAGEKPQCKPTLDTMRFTALFIHNMFLNADTHKHSTSTIIEHTTREYAVRYEMLSDIGEKILKRMQEAR